MRQPLLSLSLLFLSVLLSNCGNSSSSGGGAPVETQSSLEFYLSDGDCFRASNNTPVSQSNCNNLDFELADGICVRQSDQIQVSIGNCINTNFFRGSGLCFNRSGAEVDEGFCINGTSSNGDDDDIDNADGLPTKVCDGQYILFRQDGIYYGECDGIRGGNCSQRRLFEERSGQFVYCL